MICSPVFFRIFLWYYSLFYSKIKRIMEKYILTNDIIKNHTERMLNLRKFYPFFSILESGISAPSESGSTSLDMGYITLAVLRFLINENNFNEREVTSQEIRKFIAELLTRDFELSLSKGDMESLTENIFDKLTNGGRAFEISFFDPADRKTKVIRVRLIEATYVFFYHFGFSIFYIYTDR